LGERFSFSAAGQKEMSLLTAGNEIVALGGGCRRSKIQLAVGNAQNVLGLDPGTALNAGGLLVSQITLVCLFTCSR